ncbi:MAG: DUF885 domain-containing protein [Deltaproteobacteria bacterium]|nr:DUF885 domain-containing protein [Deltaproteobacteria bacterium]
MSLFLFFSPAVFSSDNKEGERFHKFLDDEWRYAMQEYPEWATSVGHKGDNNRWTDISLPAFSRRYAHKKEALERLLKIERAGLDEKERLNYDLYLYDLKLEIDGERFKDRYLRISQMGGIQKSIENTLKRSPAAGLKDYEERLARLKKVPEQIDNTIILLKEGLQTGATYPKITLRDVPDQIKAMTKVSDNPIMKAFEAFPSSIPDEKQKAIKDDANKILVNMVIPAFERLHEFFVNVYIPGSRDTITWSSLPDGREWYTYLAKSYTTTEMTPEEIHNLGLSEVKRIRGQIEKLMEEIGFKGGYQAFLKFMISDPQFFFKSPEELVTACRDIAKQADYGLPKLFSKLPRLPYGVLPVPAYLEKSQPAAYFQTGNMKNGVAGTFFVNTYDLPSRPRWGLIPLVLHEAVPGHHLQLALASEQEGLPNFRRYGGYTVYTEGWALYAESLGYDMELYNDTYSRFGQLNFAMWRAIRLVVDTGIHYYGWSREQAIDFFRENMAMSGHDIEVEVDRYIVMPGQALTYKIGALKIKEFRDYSQGQLEDKFDIRAFHDFILEQGALPMVVLESQVKDWVSRRMDEK